MLAPETLRTEAQELAPEITRLRRALHRCAGVGFDIEETLQLVSDELAALGLAPRRCGRAGLVACVGGKRPGPVFLLRADMDALPIAEESGVDFAAQSGKMHACGHDMHTAMLLGAARLLKAHEDELCGTVKLMFQPAEETFEGASDMIASGLLEDPKPDAALMIHVMAGMPFAPGTAIVSAPGVSAPAADYFEITVRGKGCHRSMPNKGVDPLTAAAHILLALEQINARELAMGERAVLTVGTLHAGTAPNAIADSAVMGGTLRTFDEQTRTFVKERMTQIAASMAAALRAEASVTFGTGCPTLVNDADLAACAGRYVKELLGPERAFTVAELNAAGGGASGSAGSEDFAYVSQAVPSVMLALAAGQPEQGYRWPQHHPKVKFDENALPGGAAVYAFCALRWLSEHA